MKKIVVTTLASLLVLSAAACGKGPTGYVGIGKGKAPPPVAAPAPIVTKG